MNKEPDVLCNITQLFHRVFNKEIETLNEGLAVHLCSIDNIYGAGNAVNMTERQIQDAIMEDLRRIKRILDCLHGMGLEPYSKTYGNLRVSLQ